MLGSGEGEACGHDHEDRSYSKHNGRSIAGPGGLVPRDPKALPARRGAVLPLVEQADGMKGWPHLSIPQLSATVLLYVRFPLRSQSVG